MKKKSISMLIVFVLSIIININFVKADNTYYCYYSSDDKKDIGKIRIALLNLEDETEPNKIVKHYQYRIIYEKANGTSTNLIIDEKNILNLNKTVSVKRVKLSKYMKDSTSEQEKEFNSKSCPTYVYADYKNKNAYLTNYSSNATSLKKEITNGKSSLMQNISETDYISYLSEDSNSDNDNPTVDGETWEKSCQYNNGSSRIRLYYKSGLTMIIDSYLGTSNKLYYNKPIEVANIETTTVKRTVTAENKIALNDGSGCPTVLYVYDGKEGTKREYYAAKQNKSGIFSGWSEKTYVRESSNGSMSGIDNTNPSSCDEIISSSTKALINKYLGYVHIIVPIMVLALGVFDFFKAMIASKEDEMKKAQKRFIIRLIAGVLVFLAPTIVNFIITVLNTGACPIN